MKRFRYLSMAFILSAACLLAACNTKQDEQASSQAQMSQETVPTSEVVESTEASSEESAPSSEEEKGSEFIVEEGGISVFLAQKPLEEANVRYIHAEGFLQDLGFAEAEPFYEYYDPDGNLIMTLYYDEETELGCGLRYNGQEDTFSEGGVYGFSFQGVENSEWTGYPVDNYMAITSIYGDSGAGQVNYFVETREYDGAGRLSHYDSQGVLPGTGLSDYVTVLSMNFYYHSNGKLKLREYAHSSQLFSTSGMTLNSYFDEQGRLLYEDEYITHGSLDHYYIYEGDNNTPKYRLTLDYMHSSWMPVLEKFGTQ